MLGTVLLGRRTLEIAEHTGHGSESHHSVHLSVWELAGLEILSIAGGCRHCRCVGFLQREGFCWKKSEALLGTD